MSGECDISRGLCCQLQRRHRQTPRKVTITVCLRNHLQESILKKKKEIKITILPLTDISNY